MPSRTFHGRVSLGQGLDKEVCIIEQAFIYRPHTLGLPNCPEARRPRCTIQSANQIIYF